MKKNKEVVAGTTANIKYAKATENSVYVITAY